MRSACMALAAAASPSARASPTASTSSKARWPRPSGRSAATSPAPHAVVDAVRCYAPGFIFTTALPPAIAAAATISIRHLEDEPGRARCAAAAGRRAPRRCSPRPACRSCRPPRTSCRWWSAIRELCKMASDRLLGVHDIYIQPINYPDRAARHGAPAHHADAAARRRADRKAAGRAGRDMGCAGHSLRRAGRPAVTKSDRIIPLVVPTSRGDEDGTPLPPVGGRTPSPELVEGAKGSGWGSGRLYPHPTAARATLPSRGR